MEKYHVSSLIQDFVFSSKKMGCIRCISTQVYNKIQGIGCAVRAIYASCAGTAAHRHNNRIMCIKFKGY